MTDKSQHMHHEHLMKEITNMLHPLLSGSPQAVYVYLDDTHKICNKKFADLVGYKSVKEWVDNQYPVDDIIPEDQDKGIKAYMDASTKFKASTLTGTWIKKNGQKIKTEIILAPFTYQDEVFVIHYISKK